MNAQPQFILNTFQAYYTLISTSFSLLGTATLPILAPGHGKGDSVIYDSAARHPNAPELCYCVAFPVFCPLFCCFIWAGNYPFEVTAAV